MFDGKVISVTKKGLETYDDHNVVAVLSYIMIGIMERALKSGMSVGVLRREIKDLVPSWIDFSDSNLNNLLREMKTNGSIRIE